MIEKCEKTHPSTEDFLQLLLWKEEIKEFRGGDCNESVSVNPTLKLVKSSKEDGMGNG